MINLPINKAFERLIESLATKAGVCIMSLRQAKYIHCKRLMSLATKHYQHCQKGSAEVSENRDDRSALEKTWVASAMNGIVF